MPRPVVDRPPTAVPTERDLIELAYVFNDKGKETIKGKREYIELTTSVKNDAPNRFRKFFGGNVYPIGPSILLWSITGDRMRDFCEAIYPYLRESGRAVIDEARRVDEFLSTKEAKKPTRAVEPGNVPLPQGVQVPRTTKLPSPRPTVIPLSDEDLGNNDTSSIALVYEGLKLETQYCQAASSASAIRWAQIFELDPPPDWDNTHHVYEPYGLAGIAVARIIDDGTYLEVTLL